MSPGKNRINKIETEQNEALRMIVGVERTARVDCLRLETGTISIAERIKEVAAGAALHVLYDVKNSMAKKELLYNPHPISCIRNLRQTIESKFPSKALNLDKLITKRVAPWHDIIPMFEFI